MSFAPVGPSVLYVTQPSNAVMPPTEMRWGGSHRLSYWHVHALMQSAVELVVVATSDSRLNLPETSVRLATVPGFLSMPPELRDAAFESWAVHVVTVIEEIRPDVILWQSPNVWMLDRIPLQYLSRSVFCSHYDFDRDRPRLQWLIDHPEVAVTAVSEVHRKSAADLTSRVEMIRAGVPVESFDFAERPWQAVADGRNPDLSAVMERSNGKLISQIDRVAPEKSQLFTIETFLESQLARQGWQLVVGGDSFLDPFTPVLQHTGELKEYHDEIMLIAESTNENVHVFGSLTGSEVADVYRASAFVVAPAGIHRPGYTEAFGLAPAIAQAVGTPVLASDAIDDSMFEENVSGWRIDLSDAGRQMATLANSCHKFDRKAVRQWALQFQDVQPMFDGYAQLIDRYAKPTSKKRMTP